MSSDSPVSADVSSLVLPSKTTPSTGTLSPFFTTRTSSNLISSTPIVLSSSPTFKLAKFCFIFNKSLTEFLVLLIAFSSSIFPRV